jgi:hypothetical protein
MKIERLNEETFQLYLLYDRREVESLGFAEIFVDELHEFVLLIVEAIILLFSVGGEQSKQTVKDLCARWKVNYGVYMTWR